MTRRLNAPDLRLERAVIGPGIDLLPLDELVVLDESLELVVGDEIILLAMLFDATWLACGGRDRELEVMTLREEEIDEGALAGTRGSGENYYHNFICDL